MHRFLELLRLTLSQYDLQFLAVSGIQAEFPFHLGALLHGVALVVQTAEPNLLKHVLMRLSPL